MAGTTSVSNEDILRAVQALGKEFVMLKQDVGGLKQDFGEFKEDVGTLEQDMANVKQSLDDVANDLRESMQMTSEGLDSIDREVVELKERMDGIEGETRLLKGEVKDLRRASYRHELQLSETHELAKNTYDEQRNMHTDMNEIFHRLKALHRQSATKPAS